MLNYAVHWDYVCAWCISIRRRWKYQGKETKYWNSG